MIIDYRSPLVALPGTCRRGTVRRHVRRDSRQEIRRGSSGVRGLKLGHSGVQRGGAERRVELRGWWDPRNDRSVGVGVGVGVGIGKPECRGARRETRGPFATVVVR
jgi:hypothetical protein